MISPALVLSLLVGLFHASLLVLVRGSAGRGIAMVLLVAVLGAWAGDAFASRLGFDLLAIGDFSVIGASIGAWVGIGLVSVISVLGPDRDRA